MNKRIKHINDLKTLRADLRDLEKNPELFAEEIAECKAEIARAKHETK